MTYQVKLNFHASVHPSQTFAYQKYYISGLKQLEHLSFKVNGFDKLFAYLAERKVRGTYKAWNAWANLSRQKQHVESDHVGRYFMNTGSHIVKVAIDAADGRVIRDPHAYNWADIYFKANKWPSLNYSKKVFPIVNGNGILDVNHLNFLRGLRKKEKNIDLVFIARIHSSPNGINYLNNIEHHIRLFEALSGLECSKDLLAIIPSSLPEKVMQDYLSRLDNVKVPWIYGSTISPYELWERSAKARIVFQRPGKHHCIAWRMLDLLCMGACIVYDRQPYPQWPVPLQPGKHYIDCGIGLDAEENLPSKEKYLKIRHMIEHLLQNPQTISTIRFSNIEYFENHASPRRVAEYIVNVVDGLRDVVDPKSKVQVKKGSS